MNHRQKPLVIALSLLLAAPTLIQARPVINDLRSRDVESPSVDEISAAMHEQKLVLRAGIFDPLVEQLSFRGNALQTVAQSQYAVVQFAEGRRLSADRLKALGAEVLEYIPNNAYLVRLADPSAKQLRAHTDVRFVGAWQPSWKIAPDLQNVPESMESVIVDVFGYRGGSQAEFAEHVGRNVQHAVMAGGDRIGDLPHVWFRVQRSALSDFIAQAAQTEQVNWMARFQMPVLHNRDSVGPIQSNQASAAGGPTADQASIWTKGLTGANQIVAVADSGLDRNQEFFIRLNKGSGVVEAVTNAQNTVPPTPGTVFPNNKVYGYFVMPGASPYDDDQSCGPSSTSYHGTHTSGTVAGDSGTTATPTAGNWNTGDGMAPNAQLLFQDIGDDATGCLSGVGGKLMWEQAQTAGAYISSNSYGSDNSGAYSAGDYEVDDTTFDNEQFLLVFSAGNDGPGAGTIGHPGHAKNALTVGALNHGNSTSVVSFSSRGPTSDGRRKPDIQAPGSGIISALGNDEDASANGGTSTQNLSGTSMSAPTVAGAAALMRQYFTDGYYPSGIKTAANARKPLGAELKASLMNGTLFFAGTPGTAAGWGRVWLDNNLFFSGATGENRDLRNFALPNANGLATGETNTYEVQVGAGQEFRATLAWYDPPATMAAGASLVNNLNLEVQQGANVYRGNVFTAAGATSISTTGGSADTLNNVEQVRFTAPVAGIYTVRVNAANVPGNGLRYSDRQGYGLAISSAQCATAATSAPTSINLTPGAAGLSVAATSVAGATSYQVYRTNGNCATATAGDFQFVGASATSTFLDTHAQGGVSYAYKVRAADSCGEGPISVCASAISTATCTLLPEFDPKSVVISNGPSSGSCGVDLSWSAAASACPSAATTVYNVYRSTDPFFVPAAANRIASGVSATTFTDIAVNSSQTYYYAVKAEDTTTGNSGPNGGNETPEVFRKKMTPTAATSTAGTFQDGADSPSFLSLDDAWSVSDNFAASGSLSYRSAADAAGSYTADTCSAITTPSLLINAGSVLSFKARYNVEADWDGVAMEISTNGGMTWSDLPPDGGYPGSLVSSQGNGCGYPTTQGVFNGSSGGAFISRTKALAAFAGQNAMIRWRLTSDGGAEEAGFYLDDVQVTNTSVPESCQGLTLFGNGFE